MKRAAVVAVVAAIAFGGPLTRAADAAPVRIRVDRQAYAATTPVDQCGETKTSICVGAAGSTATMVAFVHLDLEAFPRAAHLTLGEDGSAANMNAAAASIKVCVLTVELAAAFDPQQPPPYDCNLATAPARRDDGKWSVDLTRLVTVWAKIGNTGAALVASFDAVTPPPAPAVAAPEAWSVSFDRSRTSASGEFPAAPASSPPGDQDAVAAVSGEPLPATAAEPPAADARSVHEDAAPTTATLAAQVPAAPQRNAARLETAWLLAMLALLFGCAGLLAGETVRRLDPASRRSPREIAAAAAEARSRLAAPLALLAGMALVTLGAMLRR